MTAERQEVEALAALLTDAGLAADRGVTCVEDALKMAEFLRARGVRMPGSLDHLPGCASTISLPTEAIVALKDRVPFAPLYYACTCERLGAPSSAPDGPGGSVVGVDVARVHREEAP